MSLGAITNTKDNEISMNQDIHLTLPMELPKAVALVRYYLFYLLMIYIIYQYTVN